MRKDQELNLGAKIIQSPVNFCKKSFLRHTKTVGALSLTYFKSMHVFNFIGRIAIVLSARNCCKHDQSPSWKLALPSHTYGCFRPWCQVLSLQWCIGWLLYPGGHGISEIDRKGQMGRNHAEEDVICLRASVNQRAFNGLKVSFLRCEIHSSVERSSKYIHVTCIFMLSEQWQK